MTERGFAMDRQHIPSGGPRYWAALSVASILGCNTGDGFASVFGFVSGLPLLAAMFALIVFFERRDPHPRQFYYWAAIVVVRTAATNLADFTAHGLGTGLAIGALTLLLLATLLGARLLPQSGAATTGTCIELPPVDATYWTTMLIAGTLGTAIGDYVSFRAGLGLTGSSLSLSLVVVAMLAIGSAGLLATSFYYWLTIVGVRAAGTAVGDLSAKLIGLAPSAIAFSVLLVAMLSFWKDRRERTEEFGVEGA